MLIWWLILNTTSIHFFRSRYLVGRRLVNYNHQNRNRSAGTTSSTSTPPPPPPEPAPAAVAANEWFIPRDRLEKNIGLLVWSILETPRNIFSLKFEGFHHISNSSVIKHQNLTKHTHTKSTNTNCWQIMSSNTIVSDTWIPILRIKTNHICCKTRCTYLACDILIHYHPNQQTNLISLKTPFLCMSCTVISSEKIFLGFFRVEVPIKVLWLSSLKINPLFFF